MVLSPDMTKAAQRLIDYKKKSTLGREAIQAGGGQVTTMPVKPTPPGTPPKVKTPTAPAKPVKKFKGRYIGPDKYKGMSQQGKKKYKGKYAGPDKYMGRIPTKKNSPVPAYNGPSPFLPGKVTIQ